MLPCARKTLVYCDKHRRGWECSEEAGTLNKWEVAKGERTVHAGKETVSGESVTAFTDLLGRCREGWTRFVLGIGQEAMDASWNGGNYRCSGKFLRKRAKFVKKLLIEAEFPTLCSYHQGVGLVCLVFFHFALSGLLCAFIFHKNKWVC